MDDRQLLRQLQKKSRGALEAAIAQYGAYVLAIIRNRSRGVLTPEDHEEIASDVFLSLWRSAARIERGQLRPWLGAVARNQTAEVMRKKDVFLPLEDDTLITLDRLWEQMVEQERCEALARALGALPEEDREILPVLRPEPDDRTDRGRAAPECFDRPLTSDARPRNAAETFKQGRAVP